MNKKRSVDVSIYWDQLRKIREEEEVLKAKKAAINAAAMAEMQHAKLDRCECPEFSVTVRVKRTATLNESGLKQDLLLAGLEPQKVAALFIRNTVIRDSAPFLDWKARKSREEEGG